METIVSKPAGDLMETLRTQFFLLQEARQKCLDKKPDADIRKAYQELICAVYDLVHDQSLLVCVFTALDESYNKYGVDDEVFKKRSMVRNRFYNELYFLKKLIKESQELHFQTMLLDRVAKLVSHGGSYRGVLGILQSYYPSKYIIQVAHFNEVPEGNVPSIPPSGMISTKPFARSA